MHECLAAAAQLADEGIAARVIDLYSIKPIDQETLLAACRATGGRIITVEDHYPEGGLGSAVADALTQAQVPELKLVRLAVQGLPTSGAPEELLDAARHLGPAHHGGGTQPVAGSTQPDP